MFIPVRRVLLLLVFLGAVWIAAAPVRAASPDADGQVRKVLPHLLDRQGRHTLSPSLFDRDAYQAWLRRHPEEVSGLAYDVLWKARGVSGRSLTVRMEIRGLFEGTTPRETTLEVQLEGQSSIRRWTRLTLEGDDYRRFGEITAWRATLWSGDTLLDEYRSFLW